MKLPIPYPMRGLLAALVAALLLALPARADHDTTVEPETVELADKVEALAHPLTAPDDLTPLLERIGEADYVLIGEASHGTHEFYQTRAEITRRLIEERGFNSVMIEADWPSVYRVNQYVRGEGSDPDAETALSNFVDFPRWMWRNTVVVDFVEWLRDYNLSLPEGTPMVGFYGLDLYSLFPSLDEVLVYLEATDPDAAETAAALYACFEGYNDDPQQYGLIASMNPEASCEDEANEVYDLIRANDETYTAEGGEAAAQAYLNAEKNALVVRDGEEYYRVMYTGLESSWNLRDQHMFEVFKNLESYAEGQYGEAKLIVWAHNSHVGDARATDMALRGELNIGQLVRQTYGDEAVLVGFSTYTGTVTAADDWGIPPDLKQVQPGLPESFETVFHEVDTPDFLLLLDEDTAADALFDDRRLQRAIGVIYRPQTERFSHYFMTDLPQQFDAMIHIDETSALEPLEPPEGWLEAAETLDTYPFGQ